MTLTIKKFLLLVLLILFAAYAAWNWQANTKPTHKQEAHTQSLLTVRLDSAQRTFIQPKLLANGTVAAWQEAIISAEVQGLGLEEVSVSVGSVVKRGDVLARFRKQSIEDDLAQAVAHVTEAKAAWAEASANATRVRHAENSGALSKQQEDQLINAEILTKAKLQAAEAALRTQQHRLQQTVLTAPDSGIISKSVASIGQVVSPGQELFRLIRQQRIEWRGEFNSADISKVRLNMNVTLTLPDQRKTTGKVRMISPVADTSTRNITVYADMPANSAKPGMFAKGEILLPNFEVWSVPETALVIRDGFHFLMTVDEHNIVHALKVQPGSRQGGRVELLNYGTPTLRFVQKGAAFLYDGDRIRVAS